VGELQARQDALDRLEPAFEAEAEHAAEAAHLARRDVVLRMRGETRVVDHRDGRLRLEPLRDAQGARVLSADPQGERLHTADEQVGAHGVEGGARYLAVVVDLLHEIGGAADRPAEHVGVAAEVLGRAVQGDVGAQGQGVLVDGRRERVVDDHRRAGRVAGGRQPSDVDDLQRRVRRRLQVEQGAALRHRALDLLVIGRLAELGLDSETRQELEEDAVRAAVRVLHRDEPVARREQGEERAAHGGHARGEAGSGLSAFEDAQLVLEGAHRRVRVAGVDMAGDAAGSDVQPFVDVRVAVGRAVHDGHLGRPLHQGLALARPHGQRVG